MIFAAPDEILKLSARMTRRKFQLLGVSVGSGDIGKHTVQQSARALSEHDFSYWVGDISGRSW